MKQYISAESFDKSIRTSLSLVFDYNAACHRVTGWLKNLPEGKLYIRKDRGRIAFYEKQNTRQIYLSKHSDRLYLLARKKYLEQLYEILDIIRLHHSPNSSFSEWNEYNDFKFMLADSEIIIWEHSGMADKFEYNGFDLKVPHYAYGKNTFRCPHGAEFL